MKEKNPPRGSEEISRQNYQKRKEEEEEEEELVPVFHLRPQGLGIPTSPWSQKCPEPAEIREQQNQLEYISKCLAALQSRDNAAKKGQEEPREEQTLIFRTKEELEQEANYLTLVPRTIFSPTAPTVRTETKFSTRPPHHPATTAPRNWAPAPSSPTSPAARYADSTANT